MTQISMWDTIYPGPLVGHIPASGDAVAGYKGGNSWPDYDQLVALFPKAYHLSIGGRNTAARCLDVESGFAQLGDIGYWLANHAEPNPVIYTSASNVNAVRRVLSGLGKQALIWSAHYNFRPHICGPNTCGYPQADGTQWTDRALPGIDADQSLMELEKFWPQPVVVQTHYDWFPTADPNAGGEIGGPFDVVPWGPIDERQVVLHYDGARKHVAEYGGGALNPPFDGYLGVLQVELKALADRVANIAINLQPNPDGTPNWDHDHLGWRFQQLIHRAQGQQIV